MKLRSATLSGVRSIVGPEKVTFPDKGLVLLRGPSGWGKSSLLLGIAHALGCSPVPATKLRNNKGVPMEVQVILDVGDHHLRILRGATTQLHETGQQTITSATAVNERLQAITRLTPTQLRALTYRAQKKHGGFFSLEDAAKKEFLTSAMPLLEKFERAAEEAESAAAALGPKAEAAEAFVVSCRKLLAECQVPPLEVVDTSRFQSVKADMDAAVAARTSELAQAKAEQEQAVIDMMAVPVFVPEADEELDTSRQLAKAMSYSLQGLQVAEERRHAELLRKQIDAQNFCMQMEVKKNRIEAELAGLLAVNEERHTTADQGICPMCAQVLVDSTIVHQALGHADAQIVSKRVELQAAEEQLLNARGVATEARAYVPAPELRQLMDQLERVELQIIELEVKRAERNRAAQVEANERHEKARVKVDACRSKMDTAQVNLAETQRLQASAARVLLAAETANDQARAVHNSQLRELERRKQHVQEAEVVAEQLVTQVAAERDFAEMVGRNGFLGVIFDEILAEISSETNKMLANIPNTAEMVVTFKSEATTQSGKTRKAILPDITEAGVELDRTDGPSGGQESAIELAVDLAVIEVLRRRTGVDPGWLILDEPFQGCGSQDKEAWLEILGTFARERLVIVVDHSVDTNEMFESAIDVHFKDGVTTIHQGV